MHVKSIVISPNLFEAREADKCFYRSPAARPKARREDAVIGDFPRLLAGVRDSPLEPQPVLDGAALTLVVIFGWTSLLSLFRSLSPSSTHSRVRVPATTRILRESRLAAAKAVRMSRERVMAAANRDIQIGSAWFQKKINLRPQHRGVHLVTEEILRQIPELCQFSVGLCHIQSGYRHRSAMSHDSIARSNHVLSKRHTRVSY